MSNDWNHIRTIRTKNFAVTLHWTWEDDPDLSWDDTGEVLAKLNSGEWGNYTFRVEVNLRGNTVASDYLGNSIYADPEDFAKEHRKGAAYYPDMVRQAIREARQLLNDTPKMRRVA
jgi:hypothetical protein